MKKKMRVLTRIRKGESIGFRKTKMIDGKLYAITTLSPYEGLGCRKLYKG